LFWLLLFLFASISFFTYLILILISMLWFTKLNFLDMIWICSI
jgi:hypothetical protein